MKKIYVVILRSDNSARVECYTDTRKSPIYHIIQNVPRGTRASCYTIDTKTGETRFAYAAMMTAEIHQQKPLFLSEIAENRDLWQETAFFTDCIKCAGFDIAEIIANEKNYRTINK